MIKVTVLYGHPEDPEAFETYYKNKHLPLVDQVDAISKLEITKISSGPGGSASETFLMAELYFDSQTAMQEAMESPEGQAMADDLTNFATGGVKILIGSVVDNW
jgi:uncharacterized protein (TIGR02118 family)